MAPPAWESYVSNHGTRGRKNKDQDHGNLACVSARLQDIDESVSHLTRCPERPGMISVAPETSGPVEGAVDSLREDGEPLEPPRERFSTLRFDDQVNVIGLD